jgi:hypothetical protein
MVFLIGYGADILRSVSKILIANVLCAHSTITDVECGILPAHQDFFLN